jgi:hypothetical protein
MMDSTKLQESSGAVAALAWLGTSLYLCLSTPMTSLFSWSAAGFLVVGLFLAVFMFGFLTFVLQRSVTRVLLQFNRLPARRALELVGVVSLALLLAEAVLIFFAARWAFDQIVL